MKKKLTILLVALFLITAFAGCSSKNDETLSAHNGNHRTSNTQGEEQANAMILSEKITELTDGLSAVRYTGDYGFDEFLAGGGASSDAEVVSFLMESGIADFGNLLFGGNPFGCSTLSVKNTDGEALSGRNFDWNTCTADNEIVITEFIAANFGIAIGDTVTVRGDSGNGEYIVSGVESSNFQSPAPDSNNESESGAQATELVVRFGDDGDPFIMHLYDNDTAKAIARHVGTADWRLPIYNYEGYENWEVMQYYDIPGRVGEIIMDIENAHGEVIVENQICNKGVCKCCA